VPFDFPKEQVMIARDGVIAVVTLVVGLAASTGAAWTTRYSAALQAEASGFDALAHAVFDGLSVCAGSRHR
jgi:hypothetical protein